MTELGSLFSLPVTLAEVQQKYDNIDINERITVNTQNIITLFMADESIYAELLDIDSYIRSFRTEFEANMEAVATSVTQITSRIDGLVELANAKFVSIHSDISALKDLTLNVFSEHVESNVASFLAVNTSLDRLHVSVADRVQCSEFKELVNKSVQQTYYLVSDFSTMYALPEVKTGSLVHVAEAGSIFKFHDNVYEELKLGGDPVVTVQSHLHLPIEAGFVCNIPPSYRVVGMVNRIAYIYFNDYLLEEILVSNLGNVVKLPVLDDSYIGLTALVEFQYEVKLDVVSNSFPVQRDVDDKLFVVITGGQVIGKVSAYSSLYSEDVFIETVGTANNGNKVYLHYSFDGDISLLTLKVKYSILEGVVL